MIEVINPIDFISQHVRLMRPVGSCLIVSLRLELGLGGGLAAEVSEEHRVGVCLYSVKGCFHGSSYHHAALKQRNRLPQTHSHVKGARSFC